MRDRYDVINETVDKLTKLTGDDFHGYRSEIWEVIVQAMSEQHEITKQYCADACLKV